ncbi:MAG: ATP-dependent metallopeptidase FtsH/Yme1/Tma family protein, partial [Clostridia bacterium]|nr:ATP-dependent metallopeptidase FtsH/Yme1/Tma family protein [Clostridia bacterium]
MKNKNNFKSIIFYVVLIGIIVVATASIFNTMQRDELVYSDIVTMFKSGEVKSFEIDEGNNLVFTTRSGVTHTYRLLDISIFYGDLNDTIQQQLANGTIERYNYAEPTNIPWWVSRLPYVLVLLVCGGLFIFF